MSALTLIGSGIIMGIVHVLTGPDHLSALATLSSNTGNFQAFWFGVRWGIGHSIGLIFVGSIMITVSNKNGDDRIDMPELVESALESIVGAFMLLLGVFGLITANRKRGEYQMAQMDVNTINTEAEGAIVGACQNTDDESLEEKKERKVSESHLMIESYHNHTHSHYHHDNSSDHEHIHDLNGPHLSICRETYYRCMEYGCSKQILSLCIGIVHGVAGPGGVLGIIPAVQLHDWRLATLYLGTFCITSTLVMGSFAALYGSVSAYIVEKNGRGDGVNLEFHVAVFSSCLSIFVGLLWMVLIALGKLHDFFP